MKNKKWASKPKRNMMCWLDFILAEGAIPAVVEAVNNSGGIYRGGRFLCWDFEGNFFAIWNQAGNSVWIHKDNVTLLSKGTVPTLANKDVALVHDYRTLLRDETPKCGLRPTYRAGIGA